MIQLTARTSSGAILLASSAPAKPASVGESPVACPKCRKPVRFDSTRFGATIAVCGCGAKPVARVAAGAYVEPPRVNPFTPAERDARVGRPPRMVHCSVCKAEVSIHATDTRRRCKRCYADTFAVLWPRERQAALCADYATLSIAKLRVKYDCGYDMIVRILAMGNVPLRAPGKRMTSKKRPVGMPHHRGVA